MPFIGEKRSYPVLTVNPWADYIIFYYIFNKCWKKWKRGDYIDIYIDDYFLYWFFRYKILFESVLLLTFLLSLLLSGQLADSRTLPSTPHLRAGVGNGTDFWTRDWDRDWLLKTGIPVFFIKSHLFFWIFFFKITSEILMVFPKFFYQMKELV